LAVEKISSKRQQITLERLPQRLRDSFPKLTPQMRLENYNSVAHLSVRTGAILFGTLALYWQDLIIVGKEALQSELASHILAMPFLVAYFIYRKRKMLRAVLSFESSAPTAKEIISREGVGAVLCLLAFLMYWHGSYSFHPLEYHLGSLPLFVAGLLLIVFNAETLRVLAFPLVFLLFLVPPPLEIVYALGTNLSIISSQAAYAVLKAAGLPVTLTTQYGTPLITLTKSGSNPLVFSVDIACAGLYSLTGFAVFALFVAYITRESMWKKAAICLVGFPLIYALNITRIVIIVLLGAQYGMETAVQAFHLFGGWTLIFVGTLVLLILTERVFKVRLFSPVPNRTICNDCSKSVESKQQSCYVCGRILNPMTIRLSKPDWAKVVLIIFSSVLILNLQVPVFALTEGPAQVTIQTLGGGEAVTKILPEIPGYTIKFGYRDRRFEEIAGQDASLAYVYVPAATETETSRATVWIAIEVAKTRSSLHRWEVCLITWRLAKGYQPRVAQLSLRDVQLLQNPPITARYFAFQDLESAVLQVVLYWYENAYFNTGSGLEQENVKISLIAFARTPEEIPQIEDRLLPFGKAIANYWQPIKAWSQIALTIAQHGPMLMTMTAVPLAIASFQRIIQRQSEKKSSSKLYQKLALEEEKVILQAVHKAAEKKQPTVDAIALHYEKISGKRIESELLFRRLCEAEQTGLVRKQIVSCEDEPVFAWKSQISLPRT